MVGRGLSGFFFYKKSKSGLPKLHCSLQARYNPKNDSWMPLSDMGKRQFCF